MKPSVIICAYTLDRWDDLVDAVNSCAHQTLAPVEVIVIIDYNDELERRAKDAFEGVEVIANHFTKGLSGARNSGVSAARGDVLVFLDDDAYAESTWLEELCRPLSLEGVAGTGGWIVPNWPAKPPRWFPSTFLWVLGCSYQGLPENGAAIRNPIGASMAMKKEIFSAAGGFTSGLGRVGTVPLGCEETELCIRYSHNRPDQKFVIARDAIVHHRVPNARLSTKYFLSRCWAEGLSKAAVSRLVGAGGGLSSEASHVTKAIPLEIFSTLAMFATYPRDALRRISLIVSGSLVAAAGLLRGTVAVRNSPLHVEPVDLRVGQVESANMPSTLSPQEPWRPIAIVGIDISGPFGDIRIPEGHNERVWVEGMRRGQVVGREEMIAVDGCLLAKNIEEFAGRFAGCEPARDEVDDADLPRASVVVPTICRHPEDLVRTVRHLLELDYPDFEVVVVDNRRSAKDAFPDFSGDTRVRVVKESEPGISAARNHGYQVATGDFIAFTDDDVIVDSQWLRAMANRFVLSPEVDAVGGLVLPAELATEPQVWFEEYYGGFSRSLELGIFDASSCPDDPVYPYAPGRFAAGCNMAFRRNTLQRIGGFRLELGTGTPARGGEDLAAFFEIITTGGTVAFEPAALVRHFHRRTQEEFELQVHAYGVGLAAFFVCEIWHRPSHLFEILRRLPSGVRWFVRSRSERSPVGTSHYPPHLRRIQIRGIIQGPSSYLRSAIAHRRSPSV